MSGAGRVRRCIVEGVNAAGNRRFGLLDDHVLSDAHRYGGCQTFAESSSQRFFAFQESGYRVDVGDDSRSMKICAHPLRYVDAVFGRGFKFFSERRLRKCVNAVGEVSEPGLFEQRLEPFLCRFGKRFDVVAQDAGESPERSITALLEKFRHRRRTAVFG